MIRYLSDIISDHLRIGVNAPNKMLLLARLDYYEYLNARLIRNSLNLIKM